MSKSYTPFESVEEVWFWFCSSLQARGDGLRSRGDYSTTIRELEIADIYKIIKRMKLYHQITNRELRVMGNWGYLGYPPYYDKRAKNSEIRLWEKGLKALEIHLKDKRILK